MIGLTQKSSRAVDILIIEVQILSMTSIVQVTNRNSIDKWYRIEEKTNQSRRKRISIKESKKVGVGGMKEGGKEGRREEG